MSALTCVKHPSSRLILIGIPHQFVHFVKGQMFSHHLRGCFLTRNVLYFCLFFEWMSPYVQLMINFLILKNQFLTIQELLVRPSHTGSYMFHWLQSLAGSHGAIVHH